MRYALKLKGRVFDCLTVESRARNDGRYTAWNCVCVCGRKLRIRGVSLTSRNTKSCGRCFRRLYPSGTTESKEYAAYRAAKNRCSSPKDKDYPGYGGRGVRFLFRSFSEFFKELGAAPSPLHTVDRIGNGHYAPGNVRWATRQEQARSRGKFRGRFTSRFKGVFWHKKTRRWIAGITISGKNIYLGSFRDEEDAAHAYDVAALRYFGFFACLNFPTADRTSKSQLIN